MSESKNSSSDSSDNSDISWNNDTSDNQDYYVAGGSYAPYNNEPLAKKNKNNGEHDTNHGEEADEDGILPSVLERRFNGEISLENWYYCGNCHIEQLTNAREFRCCFEVLEATGKFTFIGLNRDCILNHSDYGPLTHRTVLLQVGPLLRDKDGKCYRQNERSANAENKFLRAVSYRWLARWLFNKMGWENTRPLPACVYEDIRKRHANESKGYVSGKERADTNN